ncbi:hypothetical protein MRX96_039284 [Rhipicephalus microplus]
MASCSSSGLDAAVSGSGVFTACKIKRYASTVSTSNMQRHLVDEHKLQDDSKGASRVTVKNYFQVIPRRNTTSSSRKNLLARDLVRLIARDLLPFNLVNGEELQDFFMKHGVIKELQELPDRTTLSRSALDDVYRSMHGQVKKTLVQGPRFCAVTYDLWTDSYRRRAYITFTCHLVNHKFQNLHAVEEYLAQKNTSKLEFLAKQVRRHIKGCDVIRTTERDMRPNSDALTSLARRHSNTPQHWTNEINSECHALLSKPCAQVNDVLKFWKDTQNELLWLSCLAKKMLCSPRHEHPK